MLQAEYMRRMMRERESILVIFMVLFLLVVLITTPSFFQLQDISSLLGNMGTLGIIALGETVVMVCRGIDLSVGGIMGLTALVTGNMVLHHVAGPVVVLAALSIGLVTGVANGFLVSVLRIPAIIATLGTMNILFGLMFIVTQGNWVNNVSWGLFGGAALGFPAPVYYMVAILVVLQIFHTVYPVGRYFYAVGDNPDTARLLGIRTRAVEYSSYMISGLLAGVAGLITICYLGFATPTTGSNMNLQAIAAAVIGGANVFGGKGTPLGTILGALFISIITSALVFFHLPSIWSDAGEGALILIALIADAKFATVKVRGVQSI